ncbi:MAG: V-type ATP synthase subunit E family protein [Candidatus Omnitrophica bacterium]|nr:V-type ATP synthase subunit E family protein [Candidatus Omnitrophota bacterium]
MNDKKPGNLNSENAEVICARIRQEADREVEAVRVRAAADSDKVITRAREAALEKKSALLSGLARDIQKIKEKVLSSLALEKKRLVLAEKDKFVQTVLESIKREAEGYRRNDGYAQFLENAILEGLGVIEEPHIEVYYSSLDEGLLTEAFIKKIEVRCSQAAKRTVIVKLHRSDFTDIGVIVYSADGRMMYDNRFLTRLERAKADIERELLKGSL